MTNPYEDRRKCEACGIATMELLCADVLADEVAALVRLKTIDSRSPAADALLSYRDPPSTERADLLASLRADRDRLAAEVERLKSDVATWADLASDNLKLYDQRGDEVTTLRTERDAAIAARDSAVAERDEANMRADEANAAIEKFRAVDELAKRMDRLTDDIVINDTAEAIARWLDEQSGTSKLTVTERYLIGRLAEKVRAGAWRGQNGGE